MINTIEIIQFLRIARKANENSRIIFQKKKKKKKRLFMTYEMLKQENRKNYYCAADIFFIIEYLKLLGWDGMHAFQCELAMISAFDSIVSCMSPSTTWTLCSVLISSGCSGSAMSFVWRRMLLRDGYLMRGSAEVGEEDDLASVGKTKSRKPCHRLV